MSLTAAAIGGLLVKSLKEVGKWMWGYAKKTLLTFWENKWILAIAGACSGLFIRGLLFSGVGGSAASSIAGKVSVKTSKTGGKSKK